MSVTVKSDARSAITGCRKASMLFLVMLIGLLTTTQLTAQSTYLPDEWLAAQTQPNFYDQHTLPPLSRWGWSMPFDTNVELADHWGYALEFGQVSQSVIDSLSNPTSNASKLVAMVNNDPQRYKLAVLTERPLLNATYRNGMPDSMWLQDGSGNFILRSGNKVFSPDAPDSVYQQVAADTADTLAQLRTHVPIAVVLNGGEYGLRPYGHDGAYFLQDPAVIADKGGLGWYDYLSQEKARQEKIISDAIRAAVPDREVYEFYFTDGPKHRGNYSSYWQWDWDYAQTQGTSDLPNGSNYYMQFNTGFTGSREMLSELLNSATQHIALGETLSYNWVCGGWTGNSNLFAENDRYLGFLKTYYTAGMIGGIAGYFSYPTGGFGADLTGDPPSWLVQMASLGQTHAMFSYLEKYLREGDLLPGPDMHKWSSDLPAYEFPTGDPDARVLARKLQNKDEWLITAWAAGGGDRNVTVNIDGLGDIELFARSTASVYIATLTDAGLVLRLLDPDGANPSAALNMISVTSDPGGVVDMLGDNVVLDGENFTAALSLMPGYTLTDVLLNGLSIGAIDTYDFTNVQDNQQLHFVIQSLAVPEPAAATLLALTSLALLRRRRRS